MLDEQCNIGHLVDELSCHLDWACYLMSNFFAHQKPFVSSTAVFFFRLLSPVIVAHASWEDATCNNFQDWRCNMHACKCVCKGIHWAIVDPLSHAATQWSHGGPFSGTGHFVGTRSAVVCTVLYLAKGGRKGLSKSGQWRNRRSVWVKVWRRVKVWRTVTVKSNLKTVLTLR